MNISEELLDIKVSQKRALFSDVFDENIRKESVVEICKILHAAWKKRSNMRRQHWVTPDCETIGEEVVEYVLSRYHPEADRPALSKNAEAYLASAEKNRPVPMGIDPIDAAQEIREYEDILLTETTVADHCILAVRNYRAAYGNIPMPNPEMYIDLGTELLFVILRRHRPDLVNPRKL